MIEGWTDPADRLLARSVFGTDDSEIVQDMILDWMAQQGFQPVRVDAIELSVGAAVPVTVADQKKVFVKVWPANTDKRSLAAQIKVQQGMADHGFPAPAVITKLSALGPSWAIGMEYNRAGVPTDVRIPGVRQIMARGLARFVAEAKAFHRVEGLPWRPLPAGRAIWPTPHNALFDFAATRHGAGWIDEVACQALVVMRSAESGVVVGHHDWSAKNMRVGLDNIAVLYDWDAVFIDRETFILGSAAAHFPVTWELDVPETPAIGEVAAFVSEYEKTRGAAFSCSELVEIAASA